MIETWVLETGLSDKPEKNTESVTQYPPPKRKKTICVGYLISWCWWFTPSSGNKKNSLISPGSIVYPSMFIAWITMFPHVFMPQNVYTTMFPHIYSFPHCLYSHVHMNPSFAWKSFPMRNDVHPQQQKQLEPMNCPQPGFLWSRCRTRRFMALSMKGCANGEVNKPTDIQTNR